jgi:hypothetical protein
VHAIDNIPVGADRATRARLYDRSAAKAALKLLSEQVIPANPDSPEHLLRRDFEIFIMNTIDGAEAAFNTGGRERIGIEPILEVVRKLDTLRGKLQTFKSKTGREQLGYESFVGRLSWEPASGELRDGNLYEFAESRGLVPTPFRKDSTYDEEKVKALLRQAVQGTLLAIDNGLANPQPPAAIAARPQSAAQWRQQVQVAKRTLGPIVEDVKASIRGSTEGLLESGQALQLQFSGTGA